MFQLFRSHVLDLITLRGAFKAALQAYASSGGGRTTALNLLSPGPLQTDAVYDAWGLSPNQIQSTSIISAASLGIPGTEKSKASTSSYL